MSEPSGADLWARFMAAALTVVPAYHTAHPKIRAAEAAKIADEALAEFLKRHAWKEGGRYAGGWSKK